MLVEEAIQNVQSLYSAGVQSKDTTLASRHTYSVLINARHTVLKQQLNKKQRVNSSCFQTLDCIELELAPISDCNCTIDNCNILRSKKELPKIISNLDKPIIEYIADKNGTTRFDKVEFENVKYLSGNKFTSTKGKYFIRNNRLYIVNRKLLKTVTGSILAEDPIEAKEFGNCNCDCSCDDVTTYDFHTDRDTFSSIASIAKNELIAMFGQMVNDREANAKDDVGPKGAMVHK
jgi:hypothetical protein